jgi:hypothetical protein
MAYVASLWRPLLGSGIAAAAVAAAVAAVGGSDSFPRAVLQLGVGLTVGAVTYPLALWMLWRLSGRPGGVETMAGSRIAEAAMKFLQRRQ